MLRSRGAGALVALALLALPTGAIAAAGDLDPSFAAGGIFKQQLSLGGTPMYSFGEGVAVRTDGSVRSSVEADVSASGGQLTTLGLTAAGALDTSFAGTGVLRSSASINEMSIAAAPGDKVVVAGTTSTNQIIVERYTAGGALDPTFNTTGSFVLPSTTAGPPVPDRAYAVTVDALGRVIVVGSRGSAGIVVRLTAAGHLDPTFNSAGELVEQLSATPGDDTWFTAVALAPDGDIIVGANIRFSSPSAIEGAYMAVSDVGALDTSVNATGVRAFQSASGSGIPKTLVTAIVVEPDNSVLVGGESGVGVGPGGDDYTIFQADLVHWSATGSVIVGQYQHNFGTDGVGAYKADSTINAMALDAAGRVVLAGGAGNADGNDTNHQVLVARLVPTATALDPTFGTGGFTITPMGPSNDGSTPGQLGSSARAVAMTAANKIIVAGYGQGATHDDEAMVARYENASTTAIIKASALTAIVGLPVALDGTASTGASTPIASYAWDRDGDLVTDATGPTVSVTFTTPGTHVVRLTVTDGDGLSATTTQAFTAVKLVIGHVPAPHLKLELGKLIAVASSGAFRLPVQCLAPDPCNGSLKVTITTTAKAKTHKARTRTITLGRASFSLAAGTKKSVTVKLTRSGRTFLVGRGGTARVTVTATMTSGSHKPVVTRTTTRLRVRVPKKHPHTH